MPYAYLSNSLRVDWSESNVNIADNTSTVNIGSVEVLLGNGGGAWVSGTTYINGTAVGSVSSDDASVSMDNYWDWIKVISSGGKGGCGSLKVTHNADGTATATISASYECYNDWGNGATVSGSKTITLSTIPRASSITVYDGTLGVNQTVSISRASSSFKHSLLIRNGDWSYWHVTKDTGTSWTVNVPVNWAQLNATGNTVPVEFYLETWSGDTCVGTASKTVNMTIPNSVAPSLSMSVTDPGEHYKTYGKYIQGVCTLSITLTASGSQGSTIKTYSVKADGRTYSGNWSGSSVTIATQAISSGKDFNVNASVTDSRGRSAAAGGSVPVFPYSDPKMDVFTAKRCDSEGKVDEQGTYIIVTGSASISSLGGKNVKKVTAKIWHGTTLLHTADITSSGQVIFQNMDAGNIYTVQLEISDNLKTLRYATTVGTVYATIDMLNGGKGIKLGGLATREGLDCDMVAYFTQDVSFGADAKFQLGGASMPLDSYVRTMIQTDPIIRQAIQDIARGAV